MATLAQFVEQLEDCEIIEPRTLKSLLAANESMRSAGDLARELVKQKQLTQFQAQQIYEGKAKSLVLGNYTIMEQIGAGGMGKVFKARHRRMERIVALKMLPPDVARSAATHARFQREVVAAAKLDHPNIVAAYDADLVGNEPFLVMEFVDGIDLAALVRRSGPLPVAKAVGCILQAARGLDYAHKKGIVHRDVKPANLLVDKVGRIKILDMGLARMETASQALVETQAELTAAGHIVGTTDYMAPEQALDPKTADPRSDIYSLGCTLYFLLSGKILYEGESVIGKLLAHRERPIPSLCEVQPLVPPALDEVFCRMVAKSADDRYQTMADLIPVFQNFAKMYAAPPAAPPVVGDLQPAPQGFGSSGILGKALKPDSSVDKLPEPMVEPEEEPVRGLTGSWPRQKVGIAAAIAGVLVIGAIIGLIQLGVFSPKPDDSLANVAPPPKGPSSETPRGDDDPAGQNDRQVAEWARARRNYALKIAVGKDPPLDIAAGAELPKTPFKVVELTVTGEPISEADVARLAKLTSLATLRLENAGVTDAALAKLPTLSKLETLSVAGSEGVGDEGLKHIARQSWLHWLDLSGTSVTVDGLKNLRPLTKLNRLNLSKLKLDGEWLDALRILVNLDHLQANQTLITDNDLGGLTQQRIKTLELGHTVLTDNGLQKLARLLPGLRHLAITETTVTAAGVEAFKQAVPDCVVDWSPSATSVTTTPTVTPTPTPTAEPPKTDVDRAAATWLLTLPTFRSLLISEGGATPRALQRGAHLPTAAFKIVEFTLADGTLPTVDFTRLSGLAELQRIAIRRCDLSHESLATLPPLPKLDTIDLSGNRHLTDASLKLLVTRPELRSVNVSDTGVTAPGLATLNQLPNLESLAVNNLRDLSCPMLMQLALVNKIKRLEIAGAPIGDLDVPALNLPQIKYLNMSRCKLTDVGFKQFAQKMPNLEWIDLSGTAVTLTAISEFENAVPRCIIDWTPPARQ